MFRGPRCILIPFSPFQGLFRLGCSRTDTAKMIFFGRNFLYTSCPPCVGSLFQVALPEMNYTPKKRIKQAVIKNIFHVYFVLVPFRETEAFYFQSSVIPGNLSQYPHWTRP
jgi:hypothetical protein